MQTTIQLEVGDLGRITADVEYEYPGPFDGLELKSIEGVITDKHGDELLRLDLRPFMDADASIEGVIIELVEERVAYEDCYFSAGDEADYRRAQTR